MTIGTHTTRKALSIFTIAAAAMLCAPAALADPPEGHRAQSAQLDLVERYVASGRGQADLVERWVDGRAGQLQRDLVERYVSIRRPIGFPDGRPDGYRSQVRASAPLPSTSVDGAFSWGDAGIGALAGLALTLTAGGGLLAARGRSRIAHS